MVISRKVSTSGKSKKLRPPFAVLLFILAVGLAPVVELNGRESSDWIPPGFEDLNQPVLNEIDVFYGGYFLTSVLASFTSDFITIRETGKLTAAVRDIADPKQFENLLASPLYANPQLICSRNQRTECGRIDSVAVDVIFDINNLRADLFISPELLKLRSLDQLKYLPASDAGLSLVDDMALSFSGSNRSEDSWTYNLSNTTGISRGENRVMIRSNLTRGNNNVEELYLRREVAGRDYQVGIVRRNAGNFRLMRDLVFRGVSIESSLSTRQDLTFALGNQLEIFLDSRSRVEIYKDGRLIDSEYYDIGNQVIDTSYLPDGSYEVELRVVNDANEERIEKRFYSKTSQLPPADQSLYFVQLGEQLELVDGARLPRSIGQNFLRSGISKRLGDTYGGYAGFSVNNDSSMLESGLFIQGYSYELQTLIAYDSLDTAAADLTLRYRFAIGSFTLTGRKVWEGRLKEGELSQIGNEVFQRNATLNIDSRRGNFNFFYRANDSNLDEGSESFGTRWNLYDAFAIQGLSASAEISRNDGNRLVIVGLKFRRQMEHWSGAFGSRWQSEEDPEIGKDVNRRGDIELGWRNASDSDNRISTRAKVEYLNQMIYEMALDADTRLGEAKFTARHRKGQNTSFNGTMRTSFGVAERRIGIGGRRQTNAGFLITITGDAAHSVPVDILVDDRVVATTEFNRNVFVPVSPFATYELRVIPRGESLAKVSAGVLRKTFYPGNVIPVSLKAESVFVGIGRVLDEQGLPLANAVLKNAGAFAMTDSQGFIQAELTMNQRLLVFTSGVSHCEVRLEDLQIEQQVAYLGEVFCQSIDRQEGHELPR